MSTIETKSPKINVTKAQQIDWLFCMMVLYDGFV